MQHEHAEAIRDSPLSNGDLAPTTPGRRTWGTTTSHADPGFFDQLYRYGVFVAFGISAVTYVALSAAARTEPSTAAVAE
jgi:cytosine/uracil/thiamine/allantoin permease